MKAPCTQNRTRDRIYVFNYEKQIDKGKQSSKPHLLKMLSQKNSKRTRGNVFQGWTLKSAVEMWYELSHQIGEGSSLGATLLVHVERWSLKSYMYMEEQRLPPKNLSFSKDNLPSIRQSNTQDSHWCDIFPRASSASVLVGHILLIRRIVYAYGIWERLNKWSSDPRPSLFVIIKSLCFY